MKTNLTSTDIYNYSCKHNDDYKSFLKAKNIFSPSPTFVDSSTKKEYWLYITSDLEYIISDIKDDTLLDIPRMFIKYRSYVTSDIYEYIEKACPNSKKTITDISLYNRSYKKTYAKALRQHIISIHSKVDVDTNMLCFKLMVSYRGKNINTFVDSKPKHEQFKITDEIICEVFGIDDISKAYEETLAKYLEEENSTSISWSDMCESYIYSKLLGEKSEEYENILEILPKYFSQIDKSKSTIYDNDGILFNIDYPSRKSVVLKERFYNILDSKIKNQVMLPQYINMYVKYLLDLPENEHIRSDMWHITTETNKKQIFIK